MQGVDIVLLIILTIALIKGLRDGFVLQAFSLIGLLAAVLMGVTLAPVLRDLIFPDVEERAAVAIWIVSWIVTSAVVLFLFSILSKILSTTVSATPLGFINKIVGGIFSLLATCLVLAFLIELYEMGVEKLDFPILYNPEKPIPLYEIIKRFSVLKLTS
ncbi:MAG: CvpA family protein [Porphyromonas sp.]|nr:CvpA family protein [Porphyromonas sp.]